MEKNNLFLYRKINFWYQMCAKSVIKSVQGRDLMLASALTFARSPPQPSDSKDYKCTRKQCSSLSDFSANEGVLCLIQNISRLCKVYERVVCEGTE